MHNTRTVVALVSNTPNTVPACPHKYATLGWWVGIGGECPFLGAINSFIQQGVFIVEPPYCMAYRQKIYSAGEAPNGKKRKRA